MRIAFLFPGQGSQKVGMGRDLCAAYAEAAALFEQADAILEMPLQSLCFEGPEESLTRTENTQPAIFVTSMAAVAALRAEGIEADAAAGHSVGEYAALAAAGALSFEDALRLVRRRGEIMAGIAASTPGGMAAVLGLPAETVAELCAAAAHGETVEVANYNAPDQAVISGAPDAVARASEAAKAAGAARVVRLNVSAPFHCSMMAPAAEQMAEAIEAAAFHSPRLPIVANVTADYVRTSEEIRAALLRQLASSVRWTESILRLAADGITHAVEAGPGRVLTGLLRRIAPEVTGLSAEDSKGVAAVREMLGR